MRGDLASAMPAHAVGDGEQAEPAVDAQRVFVGGAHRPGVGVSCRAHPHGAGGGAGAALVDHAHEITGDGAPRDNPAGGFARRIYSGR